MRINWIQHLRTDLFGLLLLTGFLIAAPIAGFVVILEVPVHDWGVEEWKVLKLCGGLMTGGVALVFLAEWQMASLVNRAIARRELVRTRVSEVVTEHLIPATHVRLNPATPKRSFLETSTR